MHDPRKNIGDSVQAATNKVCALIDTAVKSAKYNAEATLRGVGITKELVRPDSEKSLEDVILVHVTNTLLRAMQNRMKYKSNPYAILEQMKDLEQKDENTSDS